MCVQLVLQLKRAKRLALTLIHSQSLAFLQRQCLALDWIGLPIAWWIHQRIHASIPTTLFWIHAWPWSRGSNGQTVWKCISSFAIGQKGSYRHFLKKHLYVQLILQLKRAMRLALTLIHSQSLAFLQRQCLALDWIGLPITWWIHQRIHASIPSTLFWIHAWPWSGGSDGQTAWKCVSSFAIGQKGSLLDFLGANE